MDWESAAAFIAAIAFIHSLWQAHRADRARERADRMRFLLGEKETVAFEAGRIADKPGRAVPREMIQALVLAALFESSDRARLQVYRALGSLGGDQKKLVIGALEADLEAAAKYRRGLDLDSFNDRLRQLHAALEWTEPRQRSR